MSKIKISIRRTSFFILMATATFTIISISSLWVFTEINKSEKTIAKIKEMYIAEQQLILSSEVIHVVSLIDISRQLNDKKSTSQLQNELLDYLSSIRLNYGGYIFINQYDGRALVFDGVKIIGEKNIINLTDPDGLRIFDAELNAVQNPNGDFFMYKFKKLSTTAAVPKLSFVKGYNDWNWIIGAGIYLDDLTILIQQEKNHYQAILYKKVLYIILILVFLLIFLSIIASFISGFVKKDFNVFKAFLNQSPAFTSIISDSDLRIEEFKQIARQANIVISKQKSTEKLLKTERDRAHSYLDVADVIILALNSEGIVTLINKKGWETLGYKLEYILGKNWISYFVPLAEKQHLFDRYSYLMSDKSKIIHDNTESKIITKAGEEKIIVWHNTMLYDHDGTPSGVLCSGRDITKRRIVERSFSESEEKYKLLFEKTSDPVLIIGVENTFIDCNTAAIEILGFKNQSELIGLHPDIISPQNQPDGKLSIIKASEMIAKAKRDGFTRFEWLHCKKNKDQFHVDVSLTLIPIKGVEYLYVVWRDISESKKQYEELIIAKEKAEEGEDIKTSFLHNMQHEIRTPLNAIMGFSQLLKLGGFDAEEVNNYYDDIVKSGEQLSKIIDDIIDFSSLQAGYIFITNENTELNKFISDIFKDNISNIQDKSISLSINPCMSNNNTCVRTDVLRLKQIFGHLLSNAFKFTQEGKIEIGYCINENEIKFYVSDTGVGIEKKHLETIFDKFNRVTYKNPAKLYGGTGLGLSISKAILKILNGEIWVESEINEGSKFSFSLPYRSIAVDDDIQNDAFDNKNIAVVTNDASKLNFISHSIRETGVNIIQINDGIGAIEFCQKNYSTDLMIIDSSLVGMGCVTTIKAIKAFNKNLVIIVLFADNEEKLTKEEVLFAGGDNYIFMTQKQRNIKLALALALKPSIIVDK